MVVRDLIDGHERKIVGTTSARIAKVGIPLMLIGETTLHLALELERRLALRHLFNVTARREIQQLVEYSLGGVAGESRHIPQHLRITS